MKKIMMMCCVAIVAFCSLADSVTNSLVGTETVDGITWSFAVHEVINGECHAMVCPAPLFLYGVINPEYDPLYIGPGFIPDPINYGYGIVEILWHGDGWLGGTAIDKLTSGSITVPTKLGGYPITCIGDQAFCCCSNLTSVTIPNSVTRIGSGAFYICHGLTSITIPNSVTRIDDFAFYDCCGLASVTMPNSVSRISADAFYGCSGITNVVIPQCVCATNLSTYFPSWQSIKDIRIADGVGYITDYAFANCTGLETVTIPETVTRIGKGAFSGCNNLRSVVFLGDAPDIIGESAFAATRRSMTVSVPKGSIGWGGGFSEELPEAWNGKQIAHFESESSGVGSGVGSYNGGTLGNSASVCLTVTNVTMHYVTASVSSSAVIPPSTSGIVSVVSEVIAGSTVAIAEEWAAQYPDFTAKFGSDFAAAITKPTGKFDGEGKPMMVWQDFVAGTDPTNPDDVFTASITFDKDTNEPIVSWTPELSAAEAAKRRYKTFGKVRLNDPDWTLVDGDADHYNFFKVTVEMP